MTRTTLPKLTTARERGQEWMELYGCTPICVLRHDLPAGNPGWHHSVTAEVIAPALLGNQMVSEEPKEMLSARVSTTNLAPEVWGIETKLWVYAAGDTMELTLDQTDKLIAGLEEFLPQLRALRALQAEAEKGDQPRDEAAVSRFRAQVTAENARRSVTA